MTPEEFIAKWEPVTLTERSAAQQHFVDLCRLLDQPTPAEADPTGDTYTFEKGATKANGGRGLRIPRWSAADSTACRAGAPRTDG